MKTATENPLPTQFMRHAEAPEIPEGLRPPSVSDWRAAAWKAFSKLGLPRSGQEDFHFTSIAELRALLALPTGEGAFRVEEPDSALEMANPESFPDLNSQAEEESDALAALALTLAGKPLFLRLPAARKIEKPFSIQAHAEKSGHAALFFRLEAGSKAAVHLSSANGDFLNAAAYFSLGPGAVLDVTHDDAAFPQTLKLRFVLEAEARLNLTAASQGSRLSRLAVEADLLGAGAELDLRGAAVVAGDRRCHRHVRVRHRAPQCVSRQLFKAVVADAGRSSVDGTVVVDHGAQRTDARQLIRHLLLSKEGKADAKPRLFIHADDVKCGHGATVGRPDPEQAFYLQSRGLDASAAQRLLTEAFLAEALEASGEFGKAAKARLLATLRSPLPLGSKGAA